MPKSPTTARRPRAIERLPRVTEPLNGGIRLTPGPLAPEHVLKRSHFGRRHRSTFAVRSTALWGSLRTEDGRGGLQHQGSRRLAAVPGGAPRSVPRQTALRDGSTEPRVRRLSPEHERSVRGRLWSSSSGDGLVSPDTTGTQKV